MEKYAENVMITDLVRKTRNGVGVGWSTGIVGAVGKWNRVESTLEWSTVLYAVAPRGVAPPLLTMRTRAAPIRALL